MAKKYVKRIRRKTTYRKKPVYKRRYKRVNPKVTHLPFGQSQKVNHKYFDNVQVSTNVGVRGFYTFCLNGLYDPNITGAGHQPLGVDQVEQIFSNYCVIGARMKVTVLNNDTDEYLMAVLYVSEEPTPPTNTAELMEQGSQISRVIPPMGTSYDNGKPTVLQTKVGMKKVFKVKSLLDREDVNAVRTANPTRPLYGHIIIWQPGAGLTTANTLCCVELWQTAVWYKPRNLQYSN